MIAQCLCLACAGPIEFEVEESGSSIDCPHCGKETVLALSERDRQQAGGKARSVSKRRFSLQVKWWLLAIAVPVIGCAGYWGLRLCVRIARQIAPAMPEVGGLLLAIGIFLAVVYLAVLWVLFPVFVYFYLRSLNRRLERSNQLLEFIAKK